MNSVSRAFRTLSMGHSLSENIGIAIVVRELPIMWSTRRVSEKIRDQLYLANVAIKANEEWVSILIGCDFLEASGSWN